MLTEETGYQNYDVSDIKDIVSAKLDVKSMFTGGKLYSQTITDAITLQKFEAWFRNAEYIWRDRVRNTMRLFGIDIGKRGRSEAVYGYGQLPEFSYRWSCL